jgi:hypothetical protein
MPTIGRNRAASERIKPTHYGHTTLSRRALFKRGKPALAESQSPRKYEAFREAVTSFGLGVTLNLYLLTELRFDDRLQPSVEKPSANCSYENYRRQSNKKHEHSHSIVGIARIYHIWWIDLAIYNAEDEEHQRAREHKAHGERKQEDGKAVTAFHWILSETTPRLWLRFSGAATADKKEV